MKQPDHLQDHLYRMWRIELEARRQHLENQATRLFVARLEVLLEGYRKERS